MIERFRITVTVVPKSFGPEVSGLYNSCIRGEKLTAYSFKETAVLSILLEFKNQKSNIVDRYPRALLELAKQSNPCIRG